MKGLVSSTPMTRYIPELLAPAGSPETFFAGLSAGADAFYLGTSDFNARKRAKNFTREELEQVVALSHERGKKIYITLNTLIFDSEIPQLIDFLVFIDRIRVDAVIVQDLGVLSLIRTHFPRLRIHASTQLFCHNSLQAQFLKEAGASRIVLSRELSLSEIGAIQKEVPLEYELFIHGALCFSFSGCCLFSSYQTQSSGNRGACRQICRHRFSADAQESYPFSMKDLNSAPILESVLSIKPSALKIEGRLKNADYVTHTVSLYRKLLDHYAEQGKVPASFEALKGQRTFSTGYLQNGSYESLVEPNQQGALGEVVGTAVIPRKGCVIVQTKRLLGKGSRLRLADPLGRVICEGTLLEFFMDRQQERIEWTLTEANPYHGTLSVLLLGTTQPKSPFKVMKQALEKAKTFPVTLSAEWENDRLSLFAITLLQVKFEKQYLLPLENSPHQATLAARISALLSETGELPILAQVGTVRIPDYQFAPPARLKAIRREFFAELFGQLQEEQAKHERLIQTKALFDFAQAREVADRVNPVRMVYESETPLGQDGEVLVVSEMKGLTDEVDLRNRFMVLLPPLFISEASVGEWKQKLLKMKDAGFERVMVPSYGLVRACKEAGFLEVFAGPYLYCVNSFALRFLKEQGLDGFALSADMTDGILEPLPRRNDCFRIASWPKEVFTTRLRIPDRLFRLKGATYATIHFEEYDALREVKSSS